MDSTSSSTGAPAGRSVEEFARESGISRTTFYALTEECRPSHLRVGRRVVITETPAAWLERMTKRGGATTTAAG